MGGEVSSGSLRAKKARRPRNLGPYQVRNRLSKPGVWFGKRWRSHMRLVSGTGLQLRLGFRFGVRCGWSSLSPGNACTVHTHTLRLEREPRCPLTDGLLSWWREHCGIWNETSGRVFMTKVSGENRFSRLEFWSIRNLLRFLSFSFHFPH